MSTEPLVLRCNSCAGQFEAQNQAVAASCYHLYCTDCAQKLVEAGEPCPICGATLSRSNVKLVHLLQPSSKCRLALCGQAPQAITDAALTAINFYVEQQALGGAYTNHKLKQRMDAVQAQCKSKLTDMHNAYQQAKQKCQQVMQQKNSMYQDNQELQQKYGQKATQTRKLQEMFKALQQENDELKRRLGIRGSVGASAGAGSGQGGMLSGAPGGSGSGSGRHPSPYGGGPPQMVTTVHRQTKSVIELSPTPGSLHLLTGHGSAAIGPGPGHGGGQHAITPGGCGGGGGGFFGRASPTLGGAGMMGGGRPGTSGGMFAAGARGGALAGGGGGGMRMNRGIAGLGSPGQGMMSL